MSKLSYRLVLASMTLLIASTLGNPALAAPIAPPGDAARGKIVYERYCVSCHGTEGDGRGEAGDWIFPRPRDFRQGTFKWRSTPSGSLPTVADLEKTIRDGLYGTHMPTWYPIGHRTRLDVISYIMTFSPRWKTEDVPAPISIPAEPPMTPQSVEAGKAIYEKLQCTQCHGASGRGDGPSSHEQTNDWGDPITPADLTNPQLKCGGTAADIYRVFMTGLNGAPMPSYGDSLSTDEAWQLVHYIESLRTKTAPEFGPSGRPLH